MKKSKHHQVFNISDVMAKLTAKIFLMKLTVGLLRLTPVIYYIYYCYSKFLSPPLPEFSQITKLEIFISIFVHTLDSFDPVGGDYEVKFTLQSKWKDSRLFFNNLR